MRRKLWALGGALLLLVAGCGGKGQAGAGASPSTTGRPVDPVPPVITVGYVNQVLARLNVVYSDALRISLTTKQITPQVKTDLRAIYAGPLYQQELNAFRVQIQHPPPDLRPHIGNRITIVKQLISQRRSCVFIETTTTFSQISSYNGEPFGSEYYSLVKKVAADDPDHLNGTPWMFGFNSASLKPETAVDPCR
jgi:hypothetical protein